LHIFNVNGGKKEGGNKKQAPKAAVSNSKNNKSLFGKLGFGSLFNYFDSEFNFAHYKSNYDSLTKAVFLDTQDVVLLISYKGDCSKVEFDHEQGGERVKKAASNLLNQPLTAETKD